MALIKINRNPSAKDLKWFALLWLPLAFAIVAAILHFKLGYSTAAIVVAVAGVILSIAAFASRAAGRAIWIVWMTAAFPIGWTISHLLIAFVFYFVITPIGLLVRALGKDPMHRRFDREAKSYWIEHRPGGSPDRYFRQF